MDLEVWLTKRLGWGDCKDSKVATYLFLYGSITSHHELRFHWKSSSNGSTES